MSAFQQSLSHPYSNSKIWLKLNPYGLRQLLQLNLDMGMFILPPAHFISIFICPHPHFLQMTFHHLKEIF
jgi:hypothetical protein